MIDTERVKRIALSMMTRVPLYVFFPDGAYRDYLAIQYLNRVSKDQIPGYLSRAGRMPTFRYSTMAMALDALEEAGDPRAIRLAAEQILAANPEMPESYLALSDIATRAGRYTEGLAQARKAWLLNPRSSRAAASVVRLGYITGQDEHADLDAVVALRRFPRSKALLWLACKYCRTREQLTRIIEVARPSPANSKVISGLVRPLAAAALRARCLDVALELYLEASVIELSGEGLGTPVATKSLAGKGGRRVLQSLREVLDAEGIPFFFAAGTALGLVRNGAPLDHDNDIDVGIFESQWDRERLVRLFTEHPDFDLDDANPDSPKVGIVHREGASIDLFKFYREGDGVFHDAIFVRWKNSPFSIEQRVLEHGDVVYLPSDVDRYLAENYGDWRTPNKGFDAFVDGPNVEVTWPEYMVVHRARRAYGFIRATNLMAARRELDAIRDKLPSSIFGRQLAGEMRL